MASNELRTGCRYQELLWGDRPRMGGQVCGIAGHIKYLYALCTGMVVRRTYPSNPERIWGLVAYADDFAACFQYKEDAEMFYKRLIKRMKHFGMSLEEEKTRLIEFGRNAQEHCGRKGKKPETFTFLGFTHYCSQGKNGKFRVKRKTSRKKFAKKCKEVHRQIKGMRNQSLEEIIKKLNQILVGYYHYCGITDDGRSISNFRYCVTKSLKYWLNRRTQRKSYTWEGFNEMLKQYPLAPA